MGSTKRTAITGTMLEPSSSKTIGWSPSCECNAKREPQIVLDPFCGSGTVGEVCTRYHRNFIGVELNEDYVALANARIAAARQ